MASVKAFVSVLSEFVTELRKIYPTDKYLIKYESKIEIEDPKTILDGFVEDMKEFGSLISKKDEAFFCGDCHVVKRLHLDKLYISMDEKTLENTWTHLNNLNILASTINSVPSDLLSSIESMAEKFASEIDEDDQENPLGNLDITKLLSGVQGMLKM